MKLEEAITEVEKCVKEQIEFMSAAGEPLDPDLRRFKIRELKACWKMIKQYSRDYDKSWN